MLSGFQKREKWELRCRDGAAVAVETRLSTNYHIMLYTIAAILLILWLLGVIGVYTIGWFVHLLLIAAIIVVLIRVINGENPVA